ncbi:MAG: hypothetical protein ACLR6B_00970 [Blautia sp.]
MERAFWNLFPSRKDHWSASGKGEAGQHFSEEQRQSLAVLCRSLLTKEYENTCLVKNMRVDFDERDDLLNMMQERGNENLGLIHALAEDFSPDSLCEHANRRV